MVLFKMIVSQRSRWFTISGSFSTTVFTVSTILAERFSSIFLEYSLLRFWISFYRNCHYQWSCLNVPINTHKCQRADNSIEWEQSCTESMSTTSTLGADDVYHGSQQSTNDSFLRNTCVTSLARPTHWSVMNTQTMEKLSLCVIRFM